MFFGSYNPVTGLSTLPKLRAPASTVYGTGTGPGGLTDVYGAGRLPSLRQSATAVDMAVRGLATLPALRAFATGQSGTAGGGPGGSGGGIGAGGVFARGTLPRLIAFGDAVVTIPKITLGFGSLPRLTASGVARFQMPGVGSGKLPKLRALGIAVDGAVGLGRLRALGAYGYINVGATSNSITLLQSPGYVYIDGTGAPIFSTIDITESILFAGTTGADWVQSIVDGLRVGASSSALLEALDQVAERFGFAGVVRLAYGLLVSEAVAFGASPSASLAYALQLTDSLALAGGVGSQLNAQAAVAAAFAFGDQLANVYPTAVSEGLTLSGSAQAALRAAIRLLDSMRLQATAPLSVTFLVQHTEALQFEGALSAAATLNFAIREGLSMLGELVLPNGAYLAWVVNTETRAFVKYRNFPFNSFAKIGSHYFGASDDGVYQLGGDTDEGEPIAAVLRGALSDLGTSRMKKMPSVYVGYRADDVMLLKVVVTDAEGVRAEHTYQMEARTGALRENRVKLGRGLKSTYWGWELTNIEGADFALDSIQWYPVVLERRLG